MRYFLTPVLAACVSVLVAAAPAQAPQRRSTETALDRYVAAPDPNFAWKVLRDLPVEGARATLLEMTSQKWLTEKEVERPLWTHWVTVVRPDQVSSDIGFLFITGGSLDREPPARPPAWMIDLARDTGTVVSELRMVPNQPIVFVDDPQKKKRTEDDFIAYTWDKFLRTGDEKWPARLPMTKSAVRAMDAVAAFAASPEGGAAKVARFVVAGGSKRGWTTWTTAVVDSRVVAIIPMVIDALNVERSFAHHWRAYGAWSNAVDDYVEHGIMDWMGTPEFRALMKIEEPYEYRERLALPKFMVNASGDQFFLPDSSQFYFDDLKGEKQLRYVPNTGHSLDKTDAIASAHAFYASVVKGTRRPEMKWSFERDGSIKVTTKERPDEVRLWQASNPKARNFRFDVIGAAYTSTPLTPSGPNTWVARVPPPAAGWTAFFVEATFPTGGKYPLKVTSGVRVAPETLPFPAPTPKRTSQAPATKGKPWAVPRTPDGKPDLQGNWTNETQTPLERLGAQGMTLTDAEAKAIEDRALAVEEFRDKASDPNRPPPAKGGDAKALTAPGEPSFIERIAEAAGGAVGGYNGFWLDPGLKVIRIDGVPRSSIIIDPPNGRYPPLTDAGKKRLAERLAASKKFGEFDHPEMRPLSDRCLLSFGANAGPPMLPNYFYNNNYTIVQTRDHILILTEMVHDARIIRIGAKEHLPSHIRPWFGDSIGRWEGDTLVVETTNIHPVQLAQTGLLWPYRGASDDLKITERFTRTGPDTIVYRFTMDDPATYTAPITGELPFTRIDEQVFEYACHEGNYAMENILRGERQKEKQTPPAKQQQE